MLAVHRWLNSLVLVALCLLGASAAMANGPNQLAVNVDASGRAVGGYDTVAYFTQGTPVKGDPSISVVWKDARWLFASKENKDRFVANPEAYAPRVGGFCAVGVVAGKMVDVDPEHWLIVSGKLYLYLNAQVRELALKDLEGTIASAEALWSAK